MARREGFERGFKGRIRVNGIQLDAVRSRPSEVLGFPSWEMEWDGASFISRPREDGVPSLGMKMFWGLV